MVKDVIQSNIQNPFVSRDSFTPLTAALVHIKLPKATNASELVCCLRISGLLFSENDINHLFGAISMPWRSPTSINAQPGWGQGSYPFNPAPIVSSPFPRRLYFYLCNNIRNTSPSLPVDVTLASRLSNTHGSGELSYQVGPSHAPTLYRIHFAFLPHPPLGLYNGSAQYKGLCVAEE